VAAFADDVAAAAVVECAGGGGAGGGAAWRGIEGPPPFALAVAVVMAPAIVVAGAADEAPAGALAVADGVATEDAVDGSIAGAVDMPLELADAVELGSGVALAVVVLELAPSSVLPFFRITTAPPIRTSASRTAPPAATSTPQGVRVGRRVDGTDWLSTVA